MTVTKYKVVSGTSYDSDTPDAVIEVLERVRASGDRITIVYGDTETGEPWEDRPESGYVGRSGGSLKIPILLYDRRSIGGMAVSDSRILEIRHSNTKNGGVLYKHPKFVSEAWPLKRVGDQ